MDSCRHCGRRPRASLLRLTAAGNLVGHLFLNHAFNNSVVAANLRKTHQHWLHPHNQQRAMKRKITGFEKDDEDHWRAILDCGHRQHVRHDPPLTTRNWVLTEEGRALRLGFKLDCKRCDEEGASAD